MMLDRIYNLDCLEGMRKMKQEGISVDLILTDPPYLFRNLKAGGHSKLSASIQNVHTEIERHHLYDGIKIEHLELMWSLMKVPNIYIWCNGAQLDFYIDFFVRRHKCKMEVIIWNKTNAPPLFHGKYLSDKEYCLYFRKGGYCQPISYDAAKTVYQLPINIQDKRRYRHPTVKPLSMILNLVRNSSKEGALVLDPFSKRDCSRGRKDA